MSREPPVGLVVEPEGDDGAALLGLMRAEGFEAVWARDAETAFNVLERRPVACLIAALHAPRIDGLTLLRRARERDPDVCAVLLAGPGSAEAVATAMREGAHDVQARPVDAERLLAVVRRGVAHQALAGRVREMESRLDERLGIGRLTGSSGAIHRVIEQVRAAAPTRAAVLIEGERGTGKRLVAHTLHRLSPRKDEAFVWANCAAAGDGVVEADLFGHERGDAVQRGRLELASGGTLFLDDVDAAPAPVQLRLLRAIQTRVFERVGGSAALHADVRLVASTTASLAAAVADGRFREDLAQRLSVVRIAMPPLRERREDIPLLVDGFVRDFNREHGRRVTGITPGALDRLASHDWPGNVRELKTAIEGMVVAVGERRKLDLSDLPATVRGGRGRPRGLSIAVGMTVEEAERRLIEATLRHTQGDKRRAAEMLGIGLRTLYRKLDRLDLR